LPRLEEDRVRLQPHGDLQMRKHLAHVQIGGVDGRHIERVRGDKAHPASQGYTCEKPQRLDYYQNANDRLTAPLRRRPDGAYEEIDWDTAIAEIAEKFLDIKARHGGETILYYGGGSQGNRIDIAVQGFHARVIQHECDHVQGKVYLDRMRSMESLTFVEEWMKYGLRE